jgi:hypothetical protein
MSDPGSIIIFIVPFGFAIVIAVFIIALRGKKKLHPLEKGRAPLFADSSCGGWIGQVRSTYPFVRVAAYEDFLVIGRMNGPVLLRYDEIGKAEIERVYFTPGLVITHHNTDAPKRIIIRSQNLREMHAVIAGRMKSCR